MHKLIIYNWLVLAVASLLVGVYIGIFESFLKDKGYLFIVLAVVFGALFLVKRKGLNGKGKKSHKG
jgi:uncharacterized membrane protein YiaA